MLRYQTGKLRPTEQASGPEPQVFSGVQGKKLVLRMSWAWQAHGSATGLRA